MRSHTFLLSLILPACLTAGCASILETTPGPRSLRFCNQSWQLLEPHVQLAKVWVDPAGRLHMRVRPTEEGRHEAVLKSSIPEGIRAIRIEFEGEFGHPSTTSAFTVSVREPRGPTFHVWLASPRVHSTVTPANVRFTATDGHRHGQTTSFYYDEERPQRFVHTLSWSHKKVSFDLRDRTHTMRWLHTIDKAPAVTYPERELRVRLQLTDPSQDIGKRPAEVVITSITLVPEWTDDDSLTTSESCQDTSLLSASRSE